MTKLFQKMRIWYYELETIKKYKKRQTKEKIDEGSYALKMLDQEVDSEFLLAGVLLFSVELDVELVEDFVFTFSLSLFSL